ncbi:MAG: alpha/beta hydrolase, partial [Chloroflexota bacterium]
DGAVAVRRIERPVLFMAALSDRDAAAAAQRLYDAARDPRSLALVPGAARGARLLTGPDAGQALILLQDF